MAQTGSIRRHRSIPDPKTYIFVETEKEASFFRLGSVANSVIVDYYSLNVISIYEQTHHINNNMSGENEGTNGNGAQVGTARVKQGLAQMLKGGVIVSCRSFFFLPCNRIMSFRNGSNLRIRIDFLR